MAVAAHPDDIEFLMAGTLLLLARGGWETHYLTVANGSLGSSATDAATTTTIRRGEAREAARTLGAVFHEALVDDLEIVYDLTLVRRLTAMVRMVRPRILLVPSPADYMEDHSNVARLMVTAAFARGMPNFVTVPVVDAADQDVTVYHALPHGLRDTLRRRVWAGAYVNTSSVHHIKRTALAAHTSQQAWLDSSQGANSSLDRCDDMSREIGRMSGAFEHAEGWRRHNHLGLSRSDDDPLRDTLGATYVVDEAYEASLNYPSDGAAPNST